MGTPPSLIRCLSAPSCLESKDPQPALQVYRSSLSDQVVEDRMPNKECLATVRSSPTTVPIQGTVPCEAAENSLHWVLPTTMVLLSFLGLSTAISHHVFNVVYNGRLVDNSNWPQSVGIVLSNIVKLCLAGSVQISCTQQAMVWDVPPFFTTDTDQFIPASGSETPAED